MSIARFARTSASLISGQGILLLSQLLLPPLFLKRYGVASYGEWLTLSAAANYLGTLNFGIHNFSNNHAAIAYNRGDLDEVNVVQATAFSMLLGLTILVAVLACVIFLLPLSGLLHLTISSTAAASIVYLLGLQILVRMVFGFLQNAFLVVGALHRGNSWLNLLSIATLIASAILVSLKASFTWIAASSAFVSAAFTILVGTDLYFRARIAFPKLQYVKRSRLADILKPSGYFGMLFSVTFLVYQAPVIILQRLLGPTDVVVFSVTRTIYSMSRQALTSLSTALGPEITEMFGKTNWDGLLRLYRYSERAVFALVPVVTLTTFLSTPALLTIWLHKPGLFHPDVCILMALISAAAGVKEHKYQFQISVNSHTEMARFLFFTYVTMVFCTVPAVLWIGIRGFLVLWLTTEIVQIVYVVQLNRRLFEKFSNVETTPLYRITGVIAGGVAASCWIAAVVRPHSIWIQLVTALLFGSLLLVLEYPIFGLREVKYRLFGSRIPQRQRGS